MNLFLIIFCYLRIKVNKIKNTPSFIISEFSISSFFQFILSNIIIQEQVVYMIVDIVFVLLVIILILAIYKLKFKNDTAKINSVRVTTTLQVPIAGNGRAQEEQRPSWAKKEEPKQEIQSQSEGSQEDGKDEIVDRRKQLRKQQKAKQKKQKKQALEHYLQQQKQKREQKQKQEEQQQRLEQEKRKKQQHYYQMLAEEQQKKKKAQFDKWKDLFKVEDEGKAKQTAEVQQMKKQEFLRNLKSILLKNKLSLLQDLSHKLKISTGQVIEKIKELQGREQIKGIFDERGKYLVIEQREWDAIRNYIEARGRLKKIDIMQQCAKIIKLPENADVDADMLSIIEKESEGNS